MSGGLGTYLLQLWDRAAKGTVLLTDRFTIIAGPIISFGIWALKPAANMNIAEMFAISMGGTLLLVILLRVLASPYLVWKDQNKMIATLDVELAKPEQIERKWLADYVAKARSELSKSLALMSHLACTARIWHTSGNQTKGEIAFRTERNEQFIEARHIAFIRVEELSYIPKLRENLLDFMNACERLIDETKEHSDTRKTMQEVNNKRNEVLRILHHR